MQGTFLKEAVGTDLEAMGSHTALNSASDKVPPLEAHHASAWGAQQLCSSMRSMHAWWTG